MHKTLTTLAVLASLLFVIPSTALGSSPIQEEIADVISAHGGVQTSWNTISWEDGAITLELSTDSGARAVGSCPAGRYCAFQKVNFQGNMLSYTTCPATQTGFSALGGPIASMANSRSSGTVKGLSGATTKATLSPGQGAAIVSGIDKITCA